MRKMLALLGAALCVLAAPGSAAAKDYPDRPVTLVVAQAAGGTNDAVARFIADRLSRNMGQRFVVENKAGAGGNIGTASTARAEPDGYTLLVSVNNPLTINPSLYQSTGFDPVADFVPVSLLATAPYVLVANPKFPAKTMPELLALAKEKPNQIQYASSGIGTVNHLLVEMLGFETGTKFVHVPYRGVSSLMSDLVAGHIELGFATMPAVQSFLEGGKLTALGVSSTKRLGIAPEIPAVAETVPGYGSELWVGLFAVRGTPPEIVARLHREITKILDDPKERAALTAMGVNPATSTPEELAALLKQDLKLWQGIVAKVGVKID